MYQTFKEFYPFYLQEHSTKTCKILHFIGTSLVFLILVYSLISSVYKALWFMPLAGYGFAWVGHYVFEKNRPATFKHPLYSLRGDFTMFWHLLTGKLSFQTGATLKN